MKTLFNENEFFNEDYYERGAETGKSLYSHYRWIPELTLPMCHHIALYTKLTNKQKILDFGCAKGYTVHGLRMLGYKAFGVDVSEYAVMKAPEETKMAPPEQMEDGAIFEKDGMFFFKWKGFALFWI